MEKIKIMIVDDNENFIELVKRHIDETDKFKLIGCASDGEKGLELLKQIHDQIDLVLLDFVMPNRDGLWFLKQLDKLNIKTKVIVQTSYNTDTAIKEASKYNVNYFVLKPYDFDYMDEIIENVVLSNLTIKDHGIESKIIQILHELGVPSHIKGFQYLKDSILMVYKDNSYIGAITKLVYPEIAEKYNSTISRVERAIRHAIEVGVNRSRPDVIQEFFGTSIHYDKDKPTNSEYIATIAGCSQLELN